MRKIKYHLIIMNTQELNLLNWMKKHTQDYYVTIGNDGYMTDNEFDVYFQTRWLPKYIDSITFISMILISIYDSKIFYFTENEADKYQKYTDKNIRSLGPDKIDEIINHVLNRGDAELNILFTDSNNYQFLLSIRGYMNNVDFYNMIPCLLYTSPSPRDKRQSRIPSSA